MKKGFTLVEVMLSVLILGIGLTVAANSFVIALRGVNSASNMIGALSLAKEKYEELEAASLTNGPAASGSSEELEYSLKKYNYRQEVSEIGQDKDMEKSLIQVCIDLGWKEQNIIKNVILSAYLSKKQ